MENMVDEKAKRAVELATLIKKYQDSYYNGEGEISDAEFDRLWDELKSIDPENPILKKVGADSGSFEKAHHVMPMGSQEKAANPAQFLSWAQKHDYAEYLVEYKLDGASLELQFESGKLVRAVTRGDGTIGDDITANALKMRGVIKDLGEDFTGGVRGEVLMFKKVREELYSDKANCRNAANGVMKRKDGDGAENLNFICYDAQASDEAKSPFADEEEKVAWLSHCGFSVVPLKICSSKEDVISYRKEVSDNRKSIDYDIDGLVVKERAINRQDASRARPDRQIAFKFDLEEAETIVTSVEWSESGATYTPIATFDAVELNGTTVQHASLVNTNTIRALGLKIGSRVVVVKRGEIIPKIERVSFSPKDALDVDVPKKCASCGSELVNEGTRLYCPNVKCPKRELHQIFKWVSSLDIRDFGDTLIRALFADKKISSITSIYALSEETLSPYFLNEESLSQDKKSLGAKKVASSINARRTVKLSSFVAGFDIEGIGETLVEKLIAAGYNTLEALLSLTEEQVASVAGFAEIMARTFVQGMKENADEMRALVESGTITIEKIATDGALSGLSFCFTGELSIKRSEAQEIVKNLGGTVKTSVGKGLSYLVTNDTESGSSKNVKAAKLGIPVIDEAAFRKLAGM
jgi:DNA ligase (NAD+)